MKRIALFLVLTVAHAPAPRAQASGCGQDSSFLEMPQFYRTCGKIFAVHSPATAAYAESRVRDGQKVFRLSRAEALRAEEVFQAQFRKANREYDSQKLCRPRRCYRDFSRMYLGLEIGGQRWAYIYLYRIRDNPQATDLFSFWPDGGPDLGHGEIYARNQRLIKVNLNEGRYVLP